MLDRLDQKYLKYFRTLEQKRRAAFCVLCIEHLTRYTWRPFFWVLFFCGLWMIGVPNFLGQIALYATSLLFFIGLIYFIKADILKFDLPNIDDADRFLEHGGKIPRGSIESIRDELANPQKPITRNLWQNAQIQILYKFQQLKISAPRAFILRKDPAGLRFIAFLMFICGMLISGHQWQDRIYNGMLPFKPASIIAGSTDINLWITPPNYTQKPQIRLSDKMPPSEFLEIPQGSKIRIRLYSSLGKYFTPTLTMGEVYMPLNDLGEGLYGIDDIDIAQGQRLKIQQAFITRFSTAYTYIADQVPHIKNNIITYESNDPDIVVMSDLNNDTEKEAAEDAPPAKTYEILDNSHIRIPLIVSDDYGVKDLHMRLNIDKMVISLPLAQNFEETRLVMSGADSDFKISPVYDFTWHSWAGLPVSLTFTAIDDIGQSATLDEINIILPEREFKHPMAQSLIAMRKRLAWDYNDSFFDIADNLETLLTAPDYFQNNKGIFLSIRAASSRLRYSNPLPKAERIKAAQSVIDLLWHAAITIEDGDLSMAMRELRDAQRALENAMRNPDTDKDEIARLMDNLRNKMSNYFAEMQREMQKRQQDGKDNPQFSAEDFSQIISPDMLSKIMQDIEAALRAGDTQKAQDLMSKMQRMMEMMDPSKMAQLPMDMQVMKEGVNELQELIEQQEFLLDKTGQYIKGMNDHAWKKDIKPLDIPSIQKMLEDFGIEGTLPTPQKDKIKPEESINPDDKSKPSLSDFKTDQEALRYILGQLMLDVAEHVGEIPESMGLAEQEMRGSENELGNEAPRKASEHQELAIKYLKESQKQLSEQFRQRMQQMIGISMSGSQRLDPLGRPMGDEDPNGQNAGSDVKVPDEVQKKRVDEILRMLRERSGDRSRPDEELDYLRRLLRQF